VRGGGSPLRVRSVVGMHLEYAAIALVGALMVTRVFISLVDGHYRNALEIRRAVNTVRERAEAQIREQLAKAEKEM
jgi:hypothetical protein